jgi:hypothetical protein
LCRLALRSTAALQAATLQRLLPIGRDRLQLQLEQREIIRRERFQEAIADGGMLKARHGSAPGRGKSASGLPSACCLIVRKR